MAGPVAAARRG